MKNFPIKADDGRTYWVSRSVAVVAMAVKRSGDDLYVLVERRGRGAADYNGALCMPCGYLDFDETLKGACSRELKEETGLVIPQDRFRMISINSDPAENRQNVTVRYYCIVREDENFDPALATGGEKDEVDGVYWVNVARLTPEGLSVNHGNIDSETWAFNHENRIKSDIATVAREESMECS